eukprot:TRINITY_DN2245_c0_g1_i1.p1 TRINITY_DN2245_c0_g1~~TRINITY_DN2245_c0_g1_i1.p1  ORF type:complete len:507 (-),score=103.96 TRINITY_DN2245_c0_g1_i1:67-1587(-)
MTSRLKYAKHLLGVDGLQLLYKTSDEAVKSIVEMGNMMKKLMTIEQEYAKAVDKLLKTQKKDKENGTLKFAWECMLTELDNYAKQRNTFASIALNEIQNSLNNLVKEKERERKRLMTEGMKITKELHDSQVALAKAKQNYIKLHKEMEREQQAYNQSKNDPKMKPSNLQKIQQKVQQLQDRVSQSEMDYKVAVANANSQQTKFFENDQPKLLDEFQNFEEERVNLLKLNFTRFAQSQSDFPSAIQLSLSSLNNSINAIDVTADTDTFLDKHKNGVTPPAPINFEPCTDSTVAASSTTPPVGVSGPAPGTSGTTSSGAGGFLSSLLAPAAPAPAPAKHRPAYQDKEYGLTANDNGLSVDEKRNKLIAQQTELSGFLSSEIRSLHGLEKLVQFYSADPTGQDKTKAELQEQQKRVKVLEDHLAKVERQLAELESAQGEGEVDGETERVEVVAVAVGRFDYVATNENELSFKQGETLNILEQDASGWWYAELNGQLGFVPHNYLEVLSS